MSGDTPKALLWFGLVFVALGIFSLAAARDERLRFLTNDVAGTKGLVGFGLMFLTCGVLFVVGYLL